MLKHRVLTGAVGVPIVIVAIWLGGPWFTLLIAAAALAGAYEFYGMADLDRRQPLVYLGLLWTLALVLSAHYDDRNHHILPLVITAAVLISLVWLLASSSREGVFGKWAWMIAGALYVGWMLSHWLDLRALQPPEDGRNWVYLAMLTTFANDTGAFFIGRARGKHKLAPGLSPGKTWEGAVGGLACAVVAAVVVAAILDLISRFTSAHWQIVSLGVIVAVSAQLGDLVESLLKRSVGVKQSGSLLPGHGGILDRFDSLIFVGAVTYYYVTWVVL
ncbi:MAG: phosphatidate cytidylyltransferase [Dehalococcoidia bacterium]